MSILQLILSSLLLLPAFNGSSQTRTKKEDKDSLLLNQFAITTDFLKLNATDRLADIGSGSGYSLIPIANTCPACKFVVEDIDSLSCNAAKFQKNIEKSGGKTTISNFTFRYGTEKSTNLPPGRFNKVLAFDLVHELTYRSAMLFNLCQLLEPNGKIYISEILVHRAMKKDRNCSRPYLTETSFKELLNDNKINIDREATTYDLGQNRYIKIFECSPRP
jgi:cyclopropane fatty-acyl-phospholipid synthase-like methyltransferase